MRLLTATLAACLILAACGEKDEPAPEAEPETVDVEETAIADAPPGIQEVDYGKYCGEDAPPPLRRHPDMPVLDCIAKSVSGGDPAWGTIVLTTFEGDPVSHIYVARSESDVALFYDATMDRFGSREWEAFSCQELPSSRGLFPRSCGRSIEVGMRTPARFLEREAVRSCGRTNARAVAATRDLPQVTCFTRAYQEGESAEVVLRTLTEEGPVTDYIRTQDGSIEVFTDATEGGLGPRTWYRQECGRMGRDLTVHACDDNVDLSA